MQKSVGKWRFLARNKKVDFILFFEEARPTSLQSIVLNTPKKGSLAKA